MKAWDDPSPSGFDSLRWQIRFRAVDAHAAAGRHGDPFTVVLNQPRGTAWLDRISPFDPAVGYRRKRLRGVLYRLRYPRYSLGRWWWGMVESLTAGAWIGPGRYEGNDPRDRLRAEWLDMHREYATREAGDVEEAGHVTAFVDLDVPWSRRPETWLMEQDSRGFVEVWRCDEAYAKAQLDRAEFGVFSDVDDE